MMNQLQDMSKTSKISLSSPPSGALPRTCRISTSS